MGCRGESPVADFSREIGVAPARRRPLPPPSNPCHPQPRHLPRNHGRRSHRPPLVLLRHRRLWHAPPRPDPARPRRHNRRQRPRPRPGPHPGKIRLAGKPRHRAPPTGWQRPDQRRANPRRLRRSGGNRPRSRLRPRPRLPAPLPRRTARPPVQRRPHVHRHRRHQRQVDNDRDDRLDSHPDRPRPDDHERRRDEKLRGQRRPLRQRPRRRRRCVRLGSR